MKKLSLYISIALAGLFMGSCSEDFKDWADPQTNPQEDAITIPGFTATAAQAIDFASVTTDSVNTFSLSSAALPEGFTLGNARIELTPQGVENATKTTVNTSLDGKGAVADLASVVESAYGKRPTARTFDAQVYVNAIKEGQAVLIDAGKINLVMTPKAPFIDAAYYLVGDMFTTDDVNGWNTISDKQTFKHSDKDVYEDPIFTITFETTKADQYWKIIPKVNVDAGNTDAEAAGVVGPKVDGEDSMTGSLTNGDAKAGKIAKAGMYQMTINMMDYTYTIKQIAPEYYLVGKLQGWSDKPEGKTCLMYAESAMVQSYTTQWNADANLKIWLGSDFGNWDNAYGTTVDGDNSVEGKIAGSGAIVCPEPGAFYTFKVDFSTMTYKWTKLENQNPTAYENVSLIGVGGKWNDGDDIDMTQVAPHNWFIEKTIPEGSFKIRANHEWNDAANWGYAEGQEFSSTGKLITSGGSKDIKVSAGKYRIFFNDITLEYAIIAVAE